jgi:hypothetical protein
MPNATGCAATWRSVPAPVPRQQQRRRGPPPGLSRRARIPPVLPALDGLHPQRLEGRTAARVVSGLLNVPRCMVMPMVWPLACPRRLHCSGTAPACGSVAFLIPHLRLCRRKDIPWNP